MGKIKQGVAVASWAACVLAATTGLAGESPRRSLRQGDLNQYYARVTGGAVRMRTPSLYSSFRLTYRYDSRSATFHLNQRFASSLHRHTPIAQRIFEFDVPRFVTLEGAQDLLDAKFSFFSRLPFNRKTQAHFRPYVYFEDWLSLNHPPVTELSEPRETYVSYLGEVNRRSLKSRYFEPDFQHELDASSDSELTRGDQLTALFNGAATQEKVRLVRAARKYVFVAIMAFQCDESSNELVEALISKARQGVDVRVITEAFYPRVLFGKCARRLRAGGVDVLYLADEFKFRSRFTFMHNKFWIRDGEEAIIGGQNILKYENFSDGINHMNRDTDLSMKGPAAADLLQHFMELWETHNVRRHRSIRPYHRELARLHDLQRAAGQRGRENYTAWLGDPDTRMDGVCRILVQRPRGRNFYVADIYSRYVEEASSSVIMMSPKIRFTLNGKVRERKPSDRFFRSVREAARDRGVRMEVLSNGLDGGAGELSSFFRDKIEIWEDRGKKARGWKWLQKNRSRATARGNREYLRELAETPGIRAWAHFQYLHAKAMLFDRVAVSIGSVNLERTALDRNHESTAICMDEALSEQMETQTALDLANSVPIVSSNGI